MIFSSRDGFIRMEAPCNQGLPVFSMCYNVLVLIVFSSLVPEASAGQPEMSREQI